MISLFLERVWVRNHCSLSWMNEYITQGAPRSSKSDSTRCSGLIPGTWWGGPGCCRPYQVLLHFLGREKDAQLSVWGWVGLVGTESRTDISNGHLYGICFQPVHIDQDPTAWLGILTPPLATVSWARYLTSCFHLKMKIKTLTSSQGCLK